MCTLIFGRHLRRQFIHGYNNNIEILLNILLILTHCKFENIKNSVEQIYTATSKGATLMAFTRFGVCDVLTPCTWGLLLSATEKLLASISPPLKSINNLVPKYMIITPNETIMKPNAMIVSITNGSSGKAYTNGSTVKLTKNIKKIAIKRRIICKIDSDLKKHW